MEQLKKCPFCGGEVVTVEGAKCNYVICNICGSESALYDTREEAITAWNTRKPMERIVERLEELRMAEYDDSDEEPVYNDFDDIFDDGVSSGKFKAYLKAIKIVREEN